MKIKNKICLFNKVTYPWLGSLSQYKPPKFNLPQKRIVCVCMSFKKKNKNKQTHTHTDCTTRVTTIM